jgi:hypothetical protein
MDIKDVHVEQKVETRTVNYMSGHVVEIRSYDKETKGPLVIVVDQSGSFHSMHPSWLFPVVDVV